MFHRLAIPILALFPTLALTAEEPLPAAEGTTQDLPEATAVAPLDDNTAPAADTWRVVTVRVPVPGTFGGVREEVRVLRGDGSAVSVADGIADAGSPEAVRAHAPFPEDAPLGASSIVQHVAVLGGGGVLLALGAVAAVVSSVFAAWHWTRSTPSSLPKGTQYDVGSFVPAGPAMVLASLLVMGVGTATMVATGIHWGAGIMHTSAPDLSVLEPLRSSFAWESTEANVVVTRHNGRSGATR